MKNMSKKRLSALIIDDENLTEKPPRAIRLVECYSKGDEAETSAGDPSSISRWNNHCEDIFRRKEIEFDILSIDIRFSADGSDPYDYFNKESKASEKNTRSFNLNGLYHGLMSLARRTQTDQYGNIMPLAWEIRTASPDIANQHELQPELARLMGFFYALIGTPDADESFDKFIRKLVGGDSNSDLRDNLLQYFRDNGGLPGRGSGVTNRLAHVWRTEFEKNVKLGKISIDIERLKDYKKEFSKLLGSNMRLRDILDSDCASIPIANIKGDAEYLIPLESIFADLFPRRSVERFKGTVVTSNLVDFIVKILSHSPETPRAYRNMITRAIDYNRHLFLEQHKQYEGPIWNGSEHEINAFAFIGYMLLRHIGLRKFSARDKIKIPDYPTFFDRAHLEMDEEREGTDKKDKKSKTVNHADNWLRRSLKPSQYFFLPGVKTLGEKAIKTNLIDPLSKGEAAFGNSRIGTAFYVFLRDMGLTDIEILSAFSGLEYYKPS